jgi:galactokinase
MAGMLSVENDGGQTEPWDAFSTMRTTRAYSPGRVNLIGDHTDYNEGLALPMAIDLGTTVTYRTDGSTRVVLVSSAEPEPAVVDLPASSDPEALADVHPTWARLVGAVAGLTELSSGGHGSVSTTLPIGRGLASSAALEVACALAMGFGVTRPVPLARLCQRAEQSATGVRCGLMDQLVATSATQGNALLVDFASLSTRRVPIPIEAEVVVVDSGVRRTLAGSAYETRRRECEAASSGLVPLGLLRLEDLSEIKDPLLRKRARHVVSECDRVRLCAEAFEHADLVEAGRLMTESHQSLAEDYEVSVQALDRLVDGLCDTRGVFGARMTGAGFGGCAVALAEPGALDVAAFRTRAWRLSPSSGARVLGEVGEDSSVSTPD